MAQVERELSFKSRSISVVQEEEGIKGTLASQSDATAKTSSSMDLEKTQSQIRIDRENVKKKERIRGLWMKLKDSIHNGATALAAESERSIDVMHGIHYMKAIRTKKIHDTEFVSDAKNFVILSDSSEGKFPTFHTCSLNGKVLRKHTCNLRINRVVYTAHCKQFVTHSHMEYDLHLMDNQFTLITSAKSPHQLQNVIYNARHNEVITFGPGMIVLWEFRYSNRYLLPRKQCDLSQFGGIDLKYPTLEGTVSMHQRLYLAHDMSVVEYNLYSATVTSHQHSLHILPITCLQFYNPTKFLISGSGDGAMKIWNVANWSIITVFVGHSEEVTHLAIYPYGPCFVSASKDRTLRVWNMDICDELDQVQLTEPVSSLLTVHQQAEFITFHHRHTSLYRIQELYKLHAAVGQRIHRISQVKNPLFPERAILLCRGGTTLLVSPHNGAILTLAQMQSRRELVDVAYAPSDDSLFAAFKGGTILKYKTSTNPCEYVSKWRFDKHIEFNYLLVYEYVVDFSPDAWTGFQKSLVTKSVKGIHEVTMRQGNRTLLLAGRTDGFICVIHWQTGAVDFEIEAHGARGVLSMIANSGSDQLISAGMDNVIKVWRLFPYASEPLAPLMSFYCAHTPAHMCMLRESLGVVFQEMSSATYSLVVYDLKTGHRSDHHPHSDHSDTITALSSCDKLQLFATASHDNTVRIWNENNKLVKILNLNITPHSLSFFGQRGDLLVGIRQHLYKISYLSYLPYSYKQRMFSMSFQPEKCEDAIQGQVEQLKESMSGMAMRMAKIKEAVHGFKYHIDQLTVEEATYHAMKRAHKENAYSSLKSREDDLLSIRDNVAMSSAKAKSAKKSYKAEKESAQRGFTTYMKKYYNMFTPADPLEDPMDILNDQLDADKSKEASRTKPDEGYVQPSGPPGFYEHSYPPTNTEDNAPTHGPVVPNSVVLRIVWPEECRPVPMPDYIYRPPNFSEDQLRQIDDYNAQRAEITDQWEEGHMDEQLIRHYFLLYKLHYEERKRMKELDRDSVAEEVCRKFKEKLWSDRARRREEKRLKRENLAMLSRVIYLEDSKDELKDDETIDDKTDDASEPIILDQPRRSILKTREPTPELAEKISPATEITREESKVSLRESPLILEESPAVREESWEREESRTSFVSIPATPISRQSDVASRQSVTPVPQAEEAALLAEQKATMARMLKPTGSLTVSPTRKLSTTPISHVRSTISSTPRGLSPEEPPSVVGIHIPGTPVSSERRSPLPSIPSPKPSVPHSRPLSVGGMSRGTPPLSGSRPWSRSLREEIPLKEVASDLPYYVSQFYGLDWFDNNFLQVPSFPASPRPASMRSDVGDTFLTQTEGVKERTIQEIDLRLDEMKEWQDMVDSWTLEHPIHWSADKFLLYMMKLLNERIDYKQKTQILKAAMIVTSQEMHSVALEIVKAIIVSLNSAPPPTCLNQDQKLYIMTAIQTINHLLNLSYNTAMFIINSVCVISELLVQFIDSDPELRKVITQLWSLLGVNDPTKSIAAELDSWDSWEIENESQRKAKLLRKTAHFLESYHTKFQNHVTATVEKLAKGQTLRAHVPPDRIPTASSKGSRGSKATRTGSARSGMTRESTKSLAVSIPTTDPASYAAQATYVDTLNYFIDLKSLEVAERLGISRDRKKNTVLVMPHEPSKRALVRLGESHTDCSAKKTFCIDPVPYENANRYTPGIITGFVPKINLPMKMHYLNPFPSKFDNLDVRFHEPILITLKSSQKLFYPDKSHIPAVAESG